MWRKHSAPVDGVCAGLHRLLGLRIGLVVGEVAVWLQELAACSQQVKSRASLQLVT